MRKPEGYDDAPAVEGGYREPKPGPYVLGIVKVEVTKNKNGEQQIVLFLDIAEGEFKNYYRRQSERFDKNRYLRFYQNTEGKGMPHFKGIMKAIEDGNPGYWFDFNEAGLLHRKIGGNLREEEYIRTNDGTIGTSLRVAYLCSIQSIQAGEHKAMPVKKLAVQQQGEGTYNYDQTPQYQGGDFPPPSDDDLPF